MGTNEIDKALTVIAGIAAQDAALAARHLHPARYLDHDPRHSGGIDGLRAFIGSLAAGSPRLAVVRAIQDGAHVVTQAHGDVLGQTDFFDVFRFEDGLIVEHWAFSSQGGPPNRSGHTQVDGPVEPRDLALTEENKAVVRHYYETVHIGGQHGQIRRYMQGDVQVRHEAGVEDGVAAFERDLAIITRDRTIDEIRLLFGQGDFVFLVGQGTHEGRPCVYVDLYRVEAGKLVEHWGFPQAVPPRQERGNAAGMV